MENYISKNGIRVFIHPESHPHRSDLLEETISKIELPNDQTFFSATVDLGRIVGKDHLVEIDKGDTSFWMIRGNRCGKSHMTFKSPDDTKVVTAVFCVATDPAEYAGKWVVVTLFEGASGMREPFDKRFANGANSKEYADCLEFWKTHALSCTDNEREQAVELARTSPEFFKELWRQAFWVTIDKAIEDSNVDPREEFRVRGRIWDGCLPECLESWEDLVDAINDLIEDESCW